MPLRALHFGSAYTFATQVVRAVRGVDPEPYLHDFLDPADAAFLHRVVQPRKDTVLHLFIRNLNGSDVEREIRKFPNDSVREAAALIDSAGLPVPAWLSPDSVQPHVAQLEKLVARATHIVSDAAFHLLFADREFLFRFQEFLAVPISGLSGRAAECFLARPGILKRPAYLPRWLSRAVFHRDKGICQHCFRDLTGTINMTGILHLDHIVPLERSGSNDPTNFQLLCDRCNLKKAGRRVVPPVTTSAYW